MGNKSKPGKGGGGGDAPRKKPPPARSFRFLHVAALLAAVLIAFAAYFVGAFDLLSAAPANATASTSRPPTPPPPKRKKKRPKAADADDAAELQRPPLSEEKKSDNAAPNVVAHEPSCKDANENCVMWADQGECASNPRFMGPSCACACERKLPAWYDMETAATATTDTTKPAAAAAATTVSKKEHVTSKAVDWSEPTLEPSLALAQQEANARRAAGGATASSSSWGGGCADTPGVDCAGLARANLSACGEAEFMLTECRKTCRTCHHQPLISGLLECKDTNDNCAMWARSGECENNRRFMLSGCSRSCGVCDSKRIGCQRRNAEPGLRAPTGLTDTLHRALHEHPQHSPTALSQPSDDKPDAPYVIQFEDVINAEEAAAMISVAGDKLERSLAGDQVSHVRTSTQYWCDDSDGCTSHPVMANVTRRIMGILGMPEDNAEYFQILRYEKGQFYRVHHDQQTAHWTPQGVRVFTFFVYLSDVEAGGGTKFNDLEKVVTPKLGRAVLWPSVLARDLLTGEQKTHHEALPVEVGVKYAANLWVHLYDFKTPSRAGICPFLGQNTHGGT